MQLLRGYPKGLKVALALFVLVISLMLATSIYWYGGSIFCRSIAFCSDLAYHLGIGNSLLYSHFPPKYYFSAGTENVFPFIADLYMSVLYEQGAGFVLAVVVPSVMCFFPQLY